MSGTTVVPPGGRCIDPDAPVLPRRRTSRTQRCSPRSACTPRCSSRSFIALFPVVWVVLSSLKPAQRDPAVEHRAVQQPDARQLPSTCCSDTNFPTWFVNSVIVAAFTMLFGISMSATAGYALSRFNFPGKRPLMWVFLLTQMFPVAILIVPIYTIMANLGLIDTKASLVIAYLHRRRAVLRLDAAGLLRHHPARARRGGRARRARARSRRSGG